MVRNDSFFVSAWGMSRNAEVSVPCRFLRVQRDSGRRNPRHPDIGRRAGTICIGDQMRRTGNKTFPESTRGEAQIRRRPIRAAFAYFSLLRQKSMPPEAGQAETFCHGLLPRFARGYGLPHHPAGWFAMTGCLFLRRECRGTLRTAFPTGFCGYSVITNRGTLATPTSGGAQERIA